jgi:ADP-ribose pyrophosphatase YjhB (NUDIX family)
MPTVRKLTQEEIREIENKNNRRRKPVAQDHDRYLPLLDELQIIARNGLHYTHDPYDRERYERLMELTTRAYGEALGLPPPEVRERLSKELGHATPKVGADAAIFNAAGEILLVLRADDHCWCLPCGWVEPDESPAEAAVRETREETGLAVQPTQLIDVFYRPAGFYTGAHALVAVVYLCVVVGGNLTVSHEHLDARYWPIDAVTAWHANHRDYAVAAHRLWRDGVPG